MSMCPHTRRSGPMGLETVFSCLDSPPRARCRTQIHLWGFQFDGGGIMVLEWPGGGVGRTVSGKCRFILFKNHGQKSLIINTGIKLC